MFSVFIDYKNKLFKTFQVLSELKIFHLGSLELIIQILL